MGTEHLNGSNSESLPKVRVFPFEGGWAVGWCDGHFAIPYSKEEAIRRAIEMAVASKLPGISVADEAGPGEQWLTLESQKAKPR
jgi:hypothetical protein